MGSFQLRIFCDSRKGKGKGEKDGKRREGMGKVAPSCCCYHPASLQPLPTGAVLHWLV